MKTTNFTIFFTIAIEKCFLFVYFFFSMFRVGNPLFIYLYSTYERNYTKSRGTTYIVDTQYNIEFNEREKQLTNPSTTPNFYYIQMSDHPHIKNVPFIRFLWITKVHLLVIVFVILVTCV